MMGRRSAAPQPPQAPGWPNGLLAFVLGVAIGFAVTSRIGLFVVIGDHVGGCYLRKDQQPQQQPPPPPLTPPGSSGFIFVGVMTAQKYLWTRALAVHRTWARELSSGTVVFFAGENAQPPPGLPVVKLPGVDDSYPPQKKSFLMLKYMHDHLIDRYEWFMRADDDVMVRADRLGALLRSVNSSKTVFMGQAGTGNKEESGLLSLRADENFCMGGPGVVMSRRTLRLVAPNVRHCLKNLLSTHEDVELGRCVRRFADVPCTWSYEMQTIFYHNSSGNDAFTGELKQTEVHRAITMHPIKHHEHLHRLHAYLQSVRVRDLHHRTIGLHRDVRAAMDALHRPTVILKVLENAGDWRRLGLEPSMIKGPRTSAEDLVPWEFVQRTAFSSSHGNPRRRLEHSLAEALDGVVAQVMDTINRFAKQRGRVIDFKEIFYGYRRVDPPYGTFYILDLLLVYKKYRGRKMTLPVRKHVYLQQPFTALQLTEDLGDDRDPLYGELSGKALSLSSTPDSGVVVRAARDVWVNLRSRLRALVPNGSEATVRGASRRKRRRKLAEREVIHFILPLSGRPLAFERFLENYERVGLAKGPRTVKLVVALFGDESEERLCESKLAPLRTKYTGASLSVIRIEGAFSRAKALEAGSAHFADASNGALLFFVDVDIAFSPGALTRIRQSTVKGHQAYFPIVFSLYDPRVGNVSRNGPTDGEFRDLDPEGLNVDLGYWRLFGFGIASIFREDLVRMGGLDTSIEGWGLEDVDLFDRLMKGRLVAPFRAPDPGLVHVFHPIVCDPGLSSVQMEMCEGTKASSLASQKTLVELIKSDERSTRDSASDR